VAPSERGGDQWVAASFAIEVDSKA